MNRAFWSGVPTETRMWRGRPRPAPARTITPRRSRASKTSRLSRPTSTSTKFAWLGT